MDHPGKKKVSVSIRVYVYTQIYVQCMLEREYSLTSTSSTMFAMVRAVNSVDQEITVT